MTGLYLHPLRLKALQEGRLSVLRVPAKRFPAPDCVWCKGHGYEWIDADPSGYDYRRPCRCIKPPYAPGDYFVKELAMLWTGGAAGTQDIIYADDPEWQNAKKDQRLLKSIGYPNGKNGNWKTVPARSLSEEHARYVLTLGDPVPGKLGEVGVSEMQQEGVYASLMQDPCDMAKQIKDKYRDEWNTIYPRHPWSPDLWTWAYPVKWRKR
jgi:hypothetical protein